MCAPGARSPCPVARLGRHRLAHLHVLTARSDQVDVVLDPARVQVAADADQRAAGEVRDLTERIALLRQLEVGPVPVARLALALEEVAVRVELRALLRRPGALAVRAESALDVEDRIARWTHVQPDRIDGLDAQRVALRLRDEVDVVSDVDDLRLADRRMDHVEQ